MTSEYLVWRIAWETRDHQATDLSGASAERAYGRWNSKGKAVVYASTSIALATLETLAHTGNAAGIRNAFLVRISVPIAIWKLRKIVTAQDLDPTWLSEPPGAASIKFGDAWLASLCSPLMLVPSAIVPEEYNVLLNSKHPAINKVRAIATRQYIYDPRLSSNSIPSCFASLRAPLAPLSLKPTKKTAA